MNTLLVWVAAVCAIAGGAHVDLPEVSEITKRLGGLDLTVHLEDATAQDVAVATDVLTRQDTFIEKLIKDTLESFQKNAAVYDPLLLNQAGPFGLGSLGYSGTVTARNVNLNGFSFYVVDDVTFNPLRLELSTDVIVPWISFTTAYTARVRLMLLTYTAGGNLRVFINRLQAGVSLRMGTSILGGGHLVLRKLDVRLSIVDTNIRIDGLTGSSIVNVAINGIVNGISNGVVQSALDSASETISETVFETVNDVLRDYKLSDLIG